MSDFYKDRSSHCSGLRSWGLGLVAGLTAWSCAGTKPKRQASENRKPNVVLFYVDDMGWSDLSSSGNDFYESPAIDSLRAKSVNFTNAYSNCTVCSPSRASLLTGKYTARLRVTDWIPGHRFPFAKMASPDWTKQLKLSEQTLAEVLKGEGYVTASFGKWHLGETESLFPEQQGFDINIGGNAKGHPKSYFSPYHNPQIENGPAGEYLTDRLAKEVSKFIEANKDTAFFAYMPFYQVHTPLKAKKELEEYFSKKETVSGRWTNVTYAAMVKSTDEAVEKVMETLRKKKLLENTLVIFASDNGGLVRTIKGAKITSNYPLRAGKGSMYEGGVRVPMFMYWKGRLPEGKTINEPVMGMDIFPTVLGALGLAPSSENIDGENLLPLLEGDSLGRDAVFFHYPHYHPGGAVPYSAVRQGDWKLIHVIEENRYELYNLKEDLAESDDLSATETRRVASMRRTLDAWRTKVGAQMPVKNPDFDAGKSRHPYYAQPAKTFALRK
ncbi:sulfatase [Fulvitalea axinellae]|uniref:Sulfatase n=1 Tax=Fulvitalea axinellae TaxID=1182444 RepID=A0AAU9DAU2_9BACT|nr:sulfatase [Fulvitalea axinellae]